MDDFDWTVYSELVDDAGGERTLNVDFQGETANLVFEAYGDIAYLLDQVPAVEVFKDDGSPDQGPAGGSGFVFVLKDGSSLNDLSTQILTLRHALDADLALLSSTSS